MRVGAMAVVKYGIQRPRQHAGIYSDKRKQYIEAATQGLMARGAMA